MYTKTQPNNKKGNIKKYFLIFLFPVVLLDADELKLYENAYSVEKISPLLSISLYEKAVLHSSGKVRKTSLTRLLFLYHKFGKLEEFIILDQKIQGNLLSSKTFSKLLNDYSKGSEISQDLLRTVANLSAKKTQYSSDQLVLQLNQNNSLFLQKIVFSVKTKIKDFDGLTEVFQNINDPDTVLVEALEVKKANPASESRINNLLLQENLGNRERSDLLYLLGIFYRNQGDYNKAIQFFQESIRYGRKERGSMEIYKTYLISGSRSKACTADFRKLKIESESDEVLALYCSKDFRKVFPKIKESLKELSHSENSLIYKKILNSGE